jgi:hypothetical protein
MLTQISLTNGFSKEDAEQLWEKVKTQDYIFDDATRGRGDLFAVNLLSPNNEHFLWGEHGYITAMNIRQGVDAQLCFVLWDKLELHEIVDMAKELCRALFARHKLNRLTIYAPTFNRGAARLATLLGFRWEGEVRQGWLSHEKFHNLTFYGLLRSEFEKREVANGEPIR